MMNKIMKKLVPAAMLVLGIAMLVPASARAEEIKAQGSCGWSARWSLNTEGVLTISGSGSVDDYDSRIAEIPWKSYRSEITSVVVGDEIRTVGDYTFYGCTALKEVTLGDDVEVIGNHAFANCPALETVDGGGSLENIEGSAFRNCYALTNGEFVKGADIIGTYAFYNCRALTSVELGEGLTRVPDYAFTNAKSLASVTMGKKVSAIGNRAFYGCASLAELKIPNSVVSIGSNSFSDCDSLKEIVIPDSVMTLGKYAFSDCSGLKTVTLGKGITLIDSYTFIGCTALDELNVPVSVKEIGVNALPSDSDATIIYAGSDSQWNSIDIAGGNDGIDSDHVVCLGTEKNKISLEKCTVTLSYARGIYTGKGKQPVPTVKTADGKTLTANKDYRVSYADNVRPGKATVTITGMGSYSGTLTVNFEVIPARAQIVSLTNRSGGIYVSWKKQAEANGYQIRRKSYSADLWGKAVTVEDEATGYLDEAAQNGKTYQYQVRAVFTAEDGSVYYGPYSDARAYRRVAAPALAAPEVGNKAGTCTVRWTPDETLTGYEIMWSTDKQFADVNTRKAKILSGATGAKYLSGLESGMKYYVKVRAYYTTKGGVTYYSTWSGWRSVTVK